MHICSTPFTKAKQEALLALAKIDAAERLAKQEASDRAMRDAMDAARREVDAARIAAEVQFFFSPYFSLAFD